jgi:hypothetical protein
MLCIIIELRASREFLEFRLLIWRLKERTTSSGVFYLVLLASIAYPQEARMMVAKPLNA